jgi:hypothetical protein
MFVLPPGPRACLPLGPKHHLEMFNACCTDQARADVVLGGGGRHSRCPYLAGSHALADAPLMLLLVPTRGSLAMARMLCTARRSGARGRRRPAAAAGLFTSVCIADALLAGPAAHTSAEHHSNSGSDTCCVQRAKVVGRQKRLQAPGHSRTLVLERALWHMRPQLRAC